MQTSRTIERSLTERQRILLSSIGIMVAVALSAAAVALYILYWASFEVHKARLTEVVESRARLIEAVARFDARYSRGDVPGGSKQATLSQIIDAHERFGGFGETGEFTLARRDGDQIVWLLTHRHAGLELPNPTPLASKVAEPMRRALNGECSNIVGPDYRGVEVLAAYEAIPELGWGVVAKIDMAEVNQPFVRAGALTGGIALVLVIGGVGFILRVTSPLIRRVESRTAELLGINVDLEAEVAKRERMGLALRERGQVLGEQFTELEQLYRTAPVGLCVLDRDLRFLRINKRLAAMRGASTTALVGRMVSELLPQRLADIVVSMCRQVIETGEPILDREVTAPSPIQPESTWWWLFNCYPLKSPDGAVRGLSIVVQDTAALKEADEQLRIAHGRLQAATSEALLSEERERRKLAVDLHDGIGQLLALASMRLGILRSSAQAHGLDPQVREVEKLICEANERSGSLTFQLCPPILYDVGLVEAVRWLAEDLERSYALHVTLEDDGHRLPLDEVIRITLFRSVRELLINVAKHAQTSEAKVRFSSKDHLISIAVEDHGVGFAPGTDSGRYGLFSIQERMNHLGGSLQVESVPGQGTRVTLTAPVTSERAAEGAESA